MALDNVPEHTSSSQALWDNMSPLPSGLPANLPPQPEVIEVRGKQDGASRTPRGRSRANSNASVWSHATIESISIDGDVTPSRLLPTAFTTALQAIKTSMLPDPFNPDDVPVEHLPPPAGVHNEWDDTINQTKQDLADELVKDVVEQAIGWGAYTLVDNLDLRKGNELPFDPRTLHVAVTATLLTLDVGGAKEDGETVVTGLTPHRGRVSYVTRSTKLLNWRNDKFPIHAELDHPLTEVGAIVLMCQQLGGLFESNANHSMGRGHPHFPDSYFEWLTRTITRRIDRFDNEFPHLPSHDPPDLPAPAPVEPLTEAQRRQADAKARETLYNETLETMRLDGQVMAQINASVKDGIFADLNAQAIESGGQFTSMIFPEGARWRVVKRFQRRSNTGRSQPVLTKRRSGLVLEANLTLDDGLGYIVEETQILNTSATALLLIPYRTGFSVLFFERTRVCQRNKSAGTSG
ncbi:hypothetical protein EDB89DRAFT_2205448 [Lactarius sanguifluus]|nr:hypothetical protein EDB89DRAFT_2205448 [Lactarius sanguifluus]